MSLFAGLARQAAALPPVEQPAPPRRGGLIGGSRPSVNMGEALGFLIGGPRYVGNMRQGQRDDQAAQQAAQLAEQQRAQREQYAATIQDPRERQLFMSAPDEWAKNVGQQFAPQVVSAGSSQVVNGRRTVEQPTYSESGDTIVERSSAGVNPVFTRTTPSISEETARLNATNGVSVAPGNVLVNPQTGGQIAQGAPRILSAADGVDLVTDGGQSVYSNVRDTPATDPAILARQAEARTSMAQNLRTGLTGARRYLDAAGVLAPYLPWEMQDRADLSAQLDTLKGNITFEKLTEMKANSPNGASGLGALSDNEARMLASTVAALDPSMSQQELERSFTVIDNLVKKLEEGPAAAASTGQAPDRAALMAEARRRGLIQ